MKAIKNLLFGIALIMFGFCSCYIGSLTSWYIMELIGVALPFIGFVFAVVGYFEKED